MKKFLTVVISIALVFTSMSCALFGTRIPETANIEITSEGTTLTSGATVTTRVLFVSATVHNPGGANASTFEGYAYLAVNSDTFNVAVDYLSGSEWTFSHNVAIASGKNIIVILVYNLNHKLVEKSQDFVINGNFPVYPLRIQLTWDTDYTDVDLHVYYYSSATATSPSYHTWYSAMEPTDYGYGLYGIPNAYLDFDDTDGYGPENFTLEQLPSGGMYKAFLRYFSNHSVNSNTTATVKVYKNEQLFYTGTHTFTPSQANGDDTSNDWYFFTMNVQ